MNIAIKKDLKMNLAADFMDKVSKNKVMTDDSFKYFLTGKTHNGKKITCDPLTGVILKGYSRDQLETYSLKELSEMKLSRHVEFLQFQPRDSGYIGVDIDDHGTYSNSERARRKEAIVKGFNQFDGYMEVSSGGVGLHLLTKEGRLSDQLINKKGAVSIPKSDTGLTYDVELFGGYSTISLTGNTEGIIPDFNDEEIPKKIMENLSSVLGNKLSMQEDIPVPETPSESLSDPIISKLSVSEEDFTKRVRLLDKHKRIEKGYVSIKGQSSDTGDIDHAMANIMVKAANGDGVLASKALVYWMIEHRPKSGKPLSSSEIKRKAGIVVSKAVKELSEYTWKEPSPLEIVSYNSLPTKPPEVIYLNGVPFPKKGITMLVGQGDVGKSFITIFTAIDFLKQYPDERALFWFTEDDLSQVKKRIEMFAPDEAITSRMDFISTDVADTFTDEGATPIADLIEMTKSYGITVLDPLIAFYDGDENNNTQARVFTQKLKPMHGLVLMIHHSSKGGEASRGASDFRNAARLMYEVTASRIFMSKGSHKRTTIDPMELTSRGLLIEKDNQGITDGCRPTVRSDTKRGYMLRVFEDDPTRKSFAVEWHTSTLKELDGLGTKGGRIDEVKTLVRLNKPVSLTGASDGLD